MSPTFKIIKSVLDGYVGNALKKKLVKLAVEQITQRLFIALPFMAWGPLGSIVVWGVTKGIIFLIDETVVGAHVLYIYGDVHFDKVRVQKMIRKIRAATKEGLTDEQIKKMDDELALDLIELMEFGTV